MLGYADFVRDASRAGRSNPFLSGLLKYAAGFLVFASLAGFGLTNAESVRPYYSLLFLIHGALFCLYFGKGSIAQGFKKCIYSLVHLPQSVVSILQRTTQNILPLIINVTLCIVFLFLIKLGIQLLFGLPMVVHFLRMIPFVDPETSVHAFKSFFYQTWYVPACLAFASSGLDWLLKDKNKEEGQ